MIVDSEFEDSEEEVCYSGAIDIDPASLCLLSYGFGSLAHDLTWAPTRPSLHQTINPPPLFTFNFLTHVGTLLSSAAFHRRGGRR
jgi:hypothetical protein